MQDAASLSDKQVAQVIERGTAVVLSMMQEETIDYESGFQVPAKSFTIDRLESIHKLRDFLNKKFPTS
jgi:hypothetical protein